MKVNWQTVQNKPETSEQHQQCISEWHYQEQWWCNGSGIDENDVMMISNTDGDYNIVKSQPAEQFYYAISKVLMLVVIYPFIENNMGSSINQAL